MAWAGPHKGWGTKVRSEQWWAHTGPVTSPLYECHPSLPVTWLWTLLDHFIRRWQLPSTKKPHWSQWQWRAYYRRLPKHHAMSDCDCGWFSPRVGKYGRGKSLHWVQESSQCMSYPLWWHKVRWALTWRQGRALGQGPLVRPWPSNQPSAVLLSIINTSNNCATITMLTPLIFFLLHSIALLAHVLFLLVSYLTSNICWDITGVGKNHPSPGPSNTFFHQSILVRLRFCPHSKHSVFNCELWHITLGFK